MKPVMPGPLMIDIDGCHLNEEDAELIAHPRVGGVVLFSRNYENPAQLCTLIAAIRKCRQGELLIAVDHEGGRVQRFRDGFTSIPAMRRFGDAFDTDALMAQRAVADACRLIAHELANCDIDFSFAPCVDIDHAISSAIGDRALHDSVDGVVALARSALDGYRAGGMAGVIKHFPGHGSVQNDTHSDFAVDVRPYAEICRTDMAPFQQLLPDTAAVMPAHVIYTDVDQLPASLSSVWQTEVLRGQLGFDGVIISDDLSMRAAANIAPQSETALMALQSGTDLALICNERAAAIVACDNIEIPFGNHEQVARRLSLRRRSATQELTIEEQNDIQSRLQLLTGQVVS